MALPERRLQALLWMLFLAALALLLAGQAELAFLAFAGVLLLALSEKGSVQPKSTPEVVWTGD